MKKILIIEDTADLLEQLVDLLRMEGYDVVAFRNGAVALQKLPEIQPDLVVTDLSMPDIDGFQFIRRMRQISGVSRTPVVIFSARPREENLAEAAELNVLSYLQKPCDTDFFLNRIKEIFES